MTSFADALKDLRDIQTIANQKTFGDMLAAHEQMAARHRQISMVESLESLTASQKARANDDKVTANAAAKAAQEAVERERRRINALPQCPSCHTPIEHGTPEICARCTRPIYWCFETPMSQTQAVAFCQSPHPDAVLLSICERIEATRKAAAISVYGFGLEGISISQIEATGLAYVSDPYELGKADAIFDNASAFHLARAMALCCVTNALIECLNDRVLQIKSFMQQVAETTGCEVDLDRNAIADMARVAENIRPSCDTPFKEWLPSPMGEIDFGEALVWMMVNLEDFTPDQQRLSNVILFVVEQVIDRSPPTEKPKSGWLGSKPSSMPDKTAHLLMGQIIHGNVGRGSWTTSLYHLVRADGTRFGINHIASVEEQGVSVETLRASEVAWCDKSQSGGDGLFGPVTGGFVVKDNAHINEEVSSSGLPRYFQRQDGDCVVFSRPVKGKGQQRDENGEIGRHVPQGEEIRAALGISSGRLLDDPLKSDLVPEIRSLLQTQRAGLGTKATAANTTADPLDAFIQGMAAKMVASRLEAEAAAPVEDADGPMPQAVGGKGSEDTEANEFVVDACMKAMCLVAAVDNTLRDTEVRCIVDAMISRQVNMAVSELRSRVVSTCKKLAATGYAEAAKTLVNDLRPFKGRPLGQLVVELMETVSSADGAVGNRERQVVEFIRKGLGFE